MALATRLRRTLSVAEPLVDAVESAGALDPIGKKVGKSVRGAVPAGPVKDTLSGTYIGHPAHPLLTDVVIGSFTSANLLDLLGGDASGTARERLIALGLLAYAPTAASGMSDWADTEIASDEVRRAGLVHAGANAIAASLYAASLLARRRGAEGRGKLLATAGAGVLVAGGYLGAHLSYISGVGPDQTAFDRGPSDWTPAVSAQEVSPGAPTRVVVDDTPVMLLRQGETFFALHDRCSHRGCSLSEGKVEGDEVVCGCHGSRFSLRDGSLRRGPATAPQPAFEVRERSGELEIRRLSFGRH